MKPQGPVVLVTAGAAGIGRALAEAFLDADYRVHVCDVDDSALACLLAEKPAITGSRADVSDRAAVDGLFDELERAHGALDVLVNNAGIAGPTAAAEDIDPADWDRTLAVDLSGAFYCARRAIPLLKRAVAGSIVNISSSAAFSGFPNRAPYAAAKWGLIGLTKTLAMELGPDGIRVNAICPGSVSGSRIDGVIQRDARRQGVSPDEVRRLYRRQNSLRCFIEPADVAALALFLASPAGARISGQAIGLDGHTESLSDLRE